MRVRYVAVILALAVMAGCSTRPSAAPQGPAPADAKAGDGLCGSLILTEKEAVAWMKQRAFSTDDLAPLADALQGVHTVALGEATHGAHEIFVAKSRLVQFLVEKLGYTVLVMEASYPAAFAVDQYLQTGEGDPAEALAGLGWWITNTDEVLDLLKWLRSYNESAPPERRVRFAGFDPQILESGAAWLAERVGPADRPMLLDLAAAKYPETPEARRAWLARLEAMAATLGAGPGDPEAATRARAAQTARVLAQFVDTDLLSSNFRDAVEKRERYQAENVMALRTAYSPETRLILWGGGSHFLDEAPRMGRYLREAYGDGYYAIGVHFGEGGFNAIGASKQLEAHTVGPVGAASPKHLEALLACVQPGEFLVDLRGGQAGAPPEAWFLTLRPIRYISARYAPPAQGPVFLQARPGAQDGLLFIPKITPSLVRGLD
ncbi:MAG: erythromycin esterase [Symbiobacteriaceae bacterium]|jgi:erythromycin esterase|nr:erythromycin esterase [Symbiobacteriaceae bacterium]